MTDHTVQGAFQSRSRHVEVEAAAGLFLHLLGAVEDRGDPRPHLGHEIDRHAWGEGVADQLAELGVLGRVHVQHEQPQHVDVFVVVALPGAGDELQGIKRGLLELADIIAVNKAEGGNRERASAAAAEYSAALKILSPHADGWTVPVLLVSGLANEGLDELWQTIERFRSTHEASGAFSAKRAEQAVRWFQALLDLAIETQLFQKEDDQKALRGIKRQVRAGNITPDRAVASILARIGV